MNKYDKFKDITEKIKSNLDIVDVIGSYISIKKAGKNYSALCPFHSEDTSSFYVFPETQTFHCFGCQHHGDVINFIKDYEKISFFEALKKASSLAGMNFDFEKERKVPPEIQFNEKAIEVFNKKLLNMSTDSKVWRYLKERNINISIVNEFELGFSEGNEIKKILEEDLYKKEIAEKNGLITPIKETFAQRLIIPIRDNYGRAVGFAGRAIEESHKPKYINSSEYEYFKKSKILYLYYKTKNAIKQNDFVIVVEGYFDAISMFNAGYKNVVAVLGSTLTKDHAFELMKSTNKIITMFDNDKAGEKATFSAIEILNSKGFQVAVSKYPFKDPDELTKKYDKNRIAELLKDSYKFHEYIVEKSTDNYDLENEFGVESYLKEMAYWYKKFKLSGRLEICEAFVEKIAQELQKEKNFIVKILEQISKTLNIKKEYISEIKQNPQIIEKEIRYDFDKSFFYLWLKFPRYRKILEEFNVEVLENTPVKEFLNLYKQEKSLSYILEVSSDALSNIIADMWKEENDLEPERILSALKSTMLRLETKKSIDSLMQNLKLTTDPKTRAEITSNIINKLSKLKNHGGI